MSGAIMNMGPIRPELNDSDWESIEAALRNTRFVTTVRELRQRKNYPQLATDIFGKGDTNQGEEALNGVLRSTNTPFHLKRFGGHGGPRTFRRLAFVRWTYESQPKLPGIIARRTYRSFRR